MTTPHHPSWYVPMKYMSELEDLLILPRDWPVGRASSALQVKLFRICERIIGNIDQYNCLEENVRPLLKYELHYSRSATVQESTPWQRHASTVTSF